MFVFYSPFSALPPQVEDTEGEHHFYDNKDESFEMVTPLSWHTGCCDWPAVFSFFPWDH